MIDTERTNNKHIGCNIKPNLYIIIIIIIIIIGEVKRNSNQNSKLEFQFCAMCPKLFIFKDFYFLILESNVGPHINIHPSELLSTKTKESRINKSLKKKVFHNNKKKDLIIS